MRVINAVTKVGTEVRLRDYSIPLQNQRELASYASRYTTLFDVGYETDYTNIAQFENAMIYIWRAMSKNPYIDFAIDDVVNEMISYQDDVKYPIVLDLNSTKFSEKIRHKIHEEWIYIMKLMAFHSKAYTLLRDWYIDGKQYFYVEDNGKTITNITVLNPVRTKRVTLEDGTVKYIYQDLELQNALFEFDEKHMIEISSGLMDDKHQIWISYLNKAYVPLNQLSNIEDALLIYRIARAPERRVFYIDVGQLPKSKAETYMKEVIRNCRNVVEYDSKTGKIEERSLKMSLLDDIYLPRSADGRGTSVDTINGGNSAFSDTSDLDYFKMKLFRALNVPFTRWSEYNAPAGLLGRTAEITRDEVKYRKFIVRLRNRYNKLFSTLLRKQLSIKNIVSEKEYNEQYENIFFEWASDSMFAELRDMEILNERLNIVDRVVPNVGTLFSNTWVKQKVLRFTDAEIEQMEKEIQQEKNSGAKSPNDDPTKNNYDYSSDDNYENEKEQTING